GRGSIAATRARPSATPENTRPLVRKVCRSTPDPSTPGSRPGRASTLAASKPRESGALRVRAPAIGANPLHAAVPCGRTKAAGRRTRPVLLASARALARGSPQADDRLTCGSLRRSRFPATNTNERLVFRGRTSRHQVYSLCPRVQGDETR